MFVYLWKFVFSVFFFYLFLVCFSFYYFKLRNFDALVCQFSPIIEKNLLQFSQMNISKSEMVRKSCALNVFFRTSLYIFPCNFICPMFTHLELYCFQNGIWLLFVAFLSVFSCFVCLSPFLLTSHTEVKISYVSKPQEKVLNFYYNILLFMSLDYFLFVTFSEKRSSSHLCHY